MTNPGPWTPTGQPQTKKNRSWWIVGGVIGAALALLVAYLIGLGWDDAVEQEKARSAPTTSSAVTQASGTSGSERDPGVGRKDPNALSDDIKKTVGVDVNPVQADSIATHLCSALDEGATNRQVADEAAQASSGYWTDEQARLVALMMMLEYCPRHAE